jgi:hypothetical protein
MNVLSLLKQNAAKFYERMQTYIYPTIEATDYDRLIYYYTLLDGCEGEVKLSCDAHTKLLKKIKAIIPSKLKPFRCDGPIYSLKYIKLW